jgi:hypothetical protein
LRKRNIERETGREEGREEWAVGLDRERRGEREGSFNLFMFFFFNILLFGVSYIPPEREREREREGAPHNPEERERDPPFSAFCIRH